MEKSEASTKASLLERPLQKIFVFFKNSLSFHHRIMMRYLQKRGWVVFYLEEHNRHCNGLCWMKLYVSETGAKQKERKPISQQPQGEIKITEKCFWCRHRDKKTGICQTDDSCWFTSPVR